VNYWTVIGGLGLARITQGLTLQAEVTVFQLTRARGPETQDKSRTNLTAGLHAGHFFSPRVSLGAEVRVQRWLTNAAPVRSDPDARQQVTLGLGPRFHFKLDEKHWLRPGLSYTRAFDDPMKLSGYDVLQVGSRQFRPQLHPKKEARAPERKPHQTRRHLVLGGGSGELREAYGPVLEGNSSRSHQAEDRKLPLRQRHQPFLR
jgi:hypothetical protein